MNRLRALRAALRSWRQAKPPNPEACFTIAGWNTGRFDDAHTEVWHTAVSSPPSSTDPAALRRDAGSAGGPAQRG